MKKMIPILKIGQYTDSQGKQFDITKDMLSEIAECYDTNSAPLVKGHPNSESPAMGWIQHLTVIGNKLYASFSDIKEVFKEELKQNMFKNISASLFFPTSTSNPKQGKFCLRHVAALGASRPAIPGLGTLQDALSFSENEELISFFSSNKTSLNDECKKLLYKFQNINTNSPQFELLKELQEAKQEVLQLKEELRKKYIDEQLQLLVLENKIKPEHTNVLKDIIYKLSDTIPTPQEIVASFSELLDNTSPTIHSHRFQDCNLEEDNSYSNFSEHTNLEHTAIFADEVDKLHAMGISRNDAYKQAQQNLKKGGF